MTPMIVQDSETHDVFDNVNIPRSRIPQYPPTSLKAIISTNNKMTTTIHHPLLGLLKGLQATEALTQFRSIRYASIPRRFARSILVSPPSNPPTTTATDYTQLGPCSIQPPDSARTDATSNQLPTDIVTSEQPQSEDCLRLTITRPTSIPNGTLLPVLVFLHGGAFFVGSGERPYYSPLTFCASALAQRQQVVFVSVNYRLGALGFFHSTSAKTEAGGLLVPENNGLHDQLRAFEWVQRYIEGFGGDAGNVTAMGQSAGGESLSLHNISGREGRLYRRAIMLSGTPVTMPAKTPEEHEEKFKEMAGKLEIGTDGREGEAIAEDMIKIGVGKIRELAFVGAPCPDSEVMPYTKPTQRLSREGPKSQVDWLESQIVSSTTYDGSISYILTKQDEKRKEHAKSFVKIARETLKNPEGLLDIYGISENDEEDDALEKICLFESDVGFFLGAHAVASGFAKGDTFFQVFDLGNPFEGYLEKEQFASHTWDMVALLGAYETRLSSQYRRIVQEWRSRIIAYIATGVAPWQSWRAQGVGLQIGKEKIVECSAADLLGERRTKLLAFAEKERGPNGCDYLWEDVCRRWLMKGE